MISSTLVVSALKESHLSNTAIADATGICSLSISHYRRGLRTPNHVNTKKLAEFFCVKESQAYEPSSSTSNVNYEEIIRRKDAQIDQLLTMVARLTSIYSNVEQS